jgi:hypothetical protein
MVLPLFPKALPVLPVPELPLFPKALPEVPVPEVPLFPNALPELVPVADPPVVLPVSAPAAVEPAF